MVKYVTQREFEIFKTMIKEKMFKNSKKPYELAELMIKGFERADKRLDEQTELMMAQFDRIEGKIDRGFAGVNSDLKLIKDHLGIK